MRDMKRMELGNGLVEGNVKNPIHIQSILHGFLGEKELEQELFSFLTSLC